jgi:hypothetical protein
MSPSPYVARVAGVKLSFRLRFRRTTNPTEENRPTKPSYMISFVSA